MMRGIQSLIINLFILLGEATARRTRRIFYFMQVLVFLSDNNVPSEMSLGLSKEKNFMVLETFVNRGEENETYVMLELNKETVSDLIFTLQNLRNKMS